MNKDIEDALKYMKDGHDIKDLTSQIDPDQISQILDEDLLQAEIMARDYKEFVKGAWHVLEPASPLLENWHIDECCNLVQSVIEGELYNVIISLPPRHSKSRIVSDLLVPWVWIRNPWLRFLYAAHNEGLSIKSSKAAAMIIRSKWYRERWGHIYDFNAKDKSITTDQGGYRYVKSVAGRVTGEGGHVIIGDDLLDARDTYSEVRDKTNDWYQNVFSNRIEGGNLEEGKRIIICQRLHFMDIVGYVQKYLSEYNWQYFCLPAEYEPDRKSQIVVDGKIIAKDKRKSKGDILHPARLGKKGISAEKSKGSVYWSSQFQQEPIPEGGELIKADWIYSNIYKEDPEHWYNNCHKLIMSWDMSFGNKENKKSGISTKSSYVVGQLWGQKRTEIYLIDQVRKRFNFPETLRAVQIFKQKWPLAQEILIETKANGPAVIQSLKNKIQGIIPEDPESKSKEERLAVVSWMIEAGHVHFPDPDLPGNAWVQDNIMEALRFPAGENDDTVDAMSQALKRLQLVNIIPDYAPSGVENENNITRKNWGLTNSSDYYVDRPWNKNWSA